MILYKLVLRTQNKPVPIREDTTLMTTEPGESEVVVTTHHLIFAVSECVLVCNTCTIITYIFKNRKQLLQKIVNTSSNIL